ncbi:MAG: SAM-dependent methyltransferase, partial [Planctomycetota bacterium]|nr:SAM-dependent methyltransferase [Planctomycetota bacterium]
MSMTPEAKAKLRKTIRGTENGSDKGLRGALLLALREATEREYQLGIARVQNTSLNEERRARRKRLEDWLGEQTRAESGKHKRPREDFLRQVEKQAAYTLLNRLVMLRIMESTGLRKPFVVTGGWNSPGYKDFREFATDLCRHEADPSEGYAFLLRLIFEDLAIDLPGLYGSAGIAELVPVPASVLRR